MKRVTDDEIEATLKNLKRGNYPPFINMTKDNVEWLISLHEEIIEYRKVGNKCSPSQNNNKENDNR